MVKAIEVEDLTVGYDGNVVLENVTMDIDDKEFFGIIGPNGGGKSTLLKAITGLLRPIRGEVRIYGEPPSTGYRHLGYVPQHAEFDRDYPISVWEVVLMGRRSRRGIRPLYSEEDKDAAKEALETVEMYDLRDRHISKLSGGQRQRVFMARALASKPRILLLDEPTSSMDPQVQRNLYDFLHQLNEEVTIVLVTHNIGVVSSYVDRVACLNRYAYEHDEELLTKEMLEKSYQCPVEILTHGEVPHRVLAPHRKEK